MLSLIVFDLDGTLVDSRRDIAESANALLERCGARPLAEEVIGGMVGDGAATLVARSFAAAGLEPPPDALDSFLTIYDTRLLKHTCPYPRIREVLESLAARTRLAVLTNKPLAQSRVILSGLGLSPYFEDGAVVGGDGPFGRKPDPGGLRHLMDRAGVDASVTLLVGDSIVDLQTARRASAAACVARYGFGFGNFPVGALGPEDHVIDEPAELLRL